MQNDEDTSNWEAPESPSEEDGKKGDLIKLFQMTFEERRFYEALAEQFTEAIKARFGKSIIMCESIDGVIDAYANGPRKEFLTRIETAAKAPQQQQLKVIKVQNVLATEFDPTLKLVKIMPAARSQMHTILNVKEVIFKKAYPSETEEETTAPNDRSSILIVNMCSVCGEMLPLVGKTIEEADVSYLTEPGELAKAAGNRNDLASFVNCLQAYGYSFPWLKDALIPYQLPAGLTFHQINVSRIHEFAAFSKEEETIADSYDENLIQMVEEFNAKSKKAFKIAAAQYIKKIFLKPCDNCLALID